jgi:hypothetical protein
MNCSLFDLTNSHLADSAYFAKAEGFLVNNTDIAAALAAFKTKVGSAQCDLYFSTGTYRLSTNATMPENIRIIPANGAMFNLDVGVTFIVNGPIADTMGQIFSTTGYVNLTSNIYLDFVRPEWWGAKGDGVTNSTLAIMTADYSCKKVKFAGGTYLLSDMNGEAAVEFGGYGVSWEGVTNVQNAVVANAGKLTRIMSYGEQAHTIKWTGMVNSVFENITFSGNFVTNEVVRFDVVCTNNHFKNCTFEAATPLNLAENDGGVLISFAGNAGVDNNTFEKCWIVQKYDDGDPSYAFSCVKIDGGSNTFLNAFKDCFFAYAKYLVDVRASTGGDFYHCHFDNWKAVGGYAIVIMGLTQRLIIEDSYTEFEGQFISQTASATSSPVPIIIRNNQLNAIDTIIGLQLQQPVVLENNYLNANVSVLNTTITTGQQFYVRSRNNFFNGAFGFVGAGYLKVYDSGSTTGTGGALDGFMENVKIGFGGSKITKHLSETYLLNFTVPGAVPGEVESAEQTLTGAAMGDTVVVSFTAALPAGFILTGYVSSAGKVKIKWIQFSGAPTDPDGAGNYYRVDVWKHT